MKLRGLGRAVFRALLIALTVMLAIAVVRWYIAASRVAEVTDKVQRQTGAHSIMRSTAAATDAPGSSGALSTYRMPSAAGQATVHLHAVQAYRARAETDLAALPTANQPVDARRIAKLVELADGGNARAACVLASELTKCAFLPTIGDKELRLAEVGMREARQRGEPVEQMQRKIDGTRAILGELQTSCAGFSTDSDTRPAWYYMLQSALFGYEPAMKQFVIFPLFDPTDWSASVDAFAAYRTYYGPILDALAQRGDDFALMVAQREYGGESLDMSVFGVNVAWPHLPEDRTRALAFAYASVALRERRTGAQTTRLTEKDRAFAEMQLERRRERVELLETRVNAEERDWARQTADQLAATWGPDTISELQRPFNPDRKNRFDDVDAVCRE